MFLGKMKLVRKKKNFFHAKGRKFIKKKEKFRI